ncbi:MAG: Uma2 family endonuclease [Thermomicrobiales bacterium]
MTVAQHRLTFQDFEAFLLTGIEGPWELHDGILVEKSGMSWEHQNVIAELVRLLGNQLPYDQYRVQAESLARQFAATVFRPDVMVIPTQYGRQFRNQPGRLVIIDAPLPLVVEVWSRSTGRYDVAAKLPVYQQRGDVEIWLIHPYERTITAWRRQEDGSYAESRFTDGEITPVALPGVSIDLAAIFRE